ncbi:MAG: ATP-binding protein [Bacteroidetes bacterium]|nr:ATP-binding protein [Bacteroidota bacterium]
MKKDRVSESEILLKKAEELLKKKSEAKILELIEELAVQNEEKSKRADELLIANKELTLQQDNLNKIASRVPGLVFQYLLRPDGTSCFPYASEAIREIYRVSPDEVREDASKVFAIGHPDDLAGVIASIQSSAQTLTPWQHEYRVKFDDGTIRSLYGNAVPQKDEDGSVLWHGYISDITGRKRVEDDLRIREERYRLLAENARDVIWNMKLDGTITYISPAVEHLRGFTVEEAMQQTLEEILTPDSQRIVIDYLQKLNFAFKSGLPLPNFKGENEYCCKDGSTLCTEVLVFPLLESDGSSLTMLGVTLSERKHKEEALLESEERFRLLNETLEQRIKERTSELETTNRELEFHLKEIEQFNYIISHDLSEPINTLTNFTKLIHEEYAGKLDEAGNKSIDFINHSAIRMRLLLKGLLNYSFLGKDSVRSEVDCNKVFDEVLSYLSDEIQASGASITVKELPRIIAYETEMRLLLRELINNAIKFRKKDILPEIRILAENKGNEWVFSIADNGIGIKEQDREKVFIIFKRMVNRDDYEGTGIGLAQCKKIVEFHGGKIWVESNMEMGSTFRFTIPV